MWSLYNENNELLPPLIFSNGKSQEDIVKEVIEASKQGYKIIFIKGVCGTGKSAIALNLARHFGRTSIIVPIKSLQEQYINDYTNKKYVIKNKEKLKISPILGRKNFSCKYLQNNKQENNKSEKDSKLNDIFFENLDSKIEKNKDLSADNSIIPCKIEIKQRNSPIIKDYINKNPLARNIKFDSINQVRRMSVAPACPYYSPIIPDEYNIKIFENAKKYSYMGLQNKKFTIYEREPGCSFYEQYKSYVNSDVIIFNSAKYILETMMNRKPDTELEIIDECDEFLDNLANQEKININRLLFGLERIFSKNQKSTWLLNNLIDLTKAIRTKYETKTSPEIFEIKNTLVYDLITTIIDNQEFLDEINIDESNYIMHLDEVSRIFSDLLNETYFTIDEEDKDLIINLVTTNLRKRFDDIYKKNKIIVMMSGTIHSEYVLKNVYGLENFKIINAETETSGILKIIKIGNEFDCKYENFKYGKFKREDFLKTFSDIVKIAKPPILVHLTSFNDLPTEIEKNNYNLDLPTQKEIIKEQNFDPFGKKVNDFKEGKISILYTTKCNRGIDFPGETCNSIIISRYPYPNISSLFWKIFKKTHPATFMNFYLDKAKRELTQKIYRGLRSKNDQIYLLSPDIRVLNFKI